MVLSPKERGCWETLRSMYPNQIDNKVLADQIGTTPDGLRQVVKLLRKKLEMGVTIDNEYGTYRLVIHEHRRM